MGMLEPHRSTVPDAGAEPVSDALSSARPVSDALPCRMSQRMLAGHLSQWVQLPAFAFESQRVRLRLLNALYTLLATGTLEGQRSAGSHTQQRRPDKSLSTGRVAQGNARGPLLL